MYNMILVILTIIPFTIGQTSSPDVNGGWGPWSVDPTVDCCIFGPNARYTRSCNNPLPQGNGTTCVTANGTYATTEETWRSCWCGCWPPCDNITAFCVNDTGTGAYCKCNYNYVPRRRDDFMNITSCDQATTVTSVMTTQAPATMNPDTKKTMKLVQSISIIILLGCLATSFVSMLFCFGFKTLRIIHMNQELTLAATYALIGFLIENTADKTLCMTVAILLHYFFMCTMTFFCLEALHTYSMVTYVVPTKGFLSTIVNFILGYGIPLIPLGFSLGFLYNSYGNNGRHCWCDMTSAGTGLAWAFLFPICFGALACAVIVEAQGQGKYEPLPGMDEREYRSAKVSQHTIIMVMPIAVISYISGLLAVELQLVPLYAVFFGFTILLGVVVLLAHAIASPGLAKYCGCGSSRPTSSGRVAPTPEPTPVKMH